MLELSLASISKRYLKEELAFQTDPKAQEALSSALAYFNELEIKNKAIWSDFLNTLPEQIEIFNKKLVPFKLQLTFKLTEKEDYKHVYFYYELLNADHNRTLYFTKFTNEYNLVFLHERSRINPDLSSLLNELHDRFTSERNQNNLPGIYDYLI